MQALNFDYRDILKAPRLAWSVRKMYLSCRGILLAWGIYLMFSYAALFFTPARAESGIVELFRYFEFFPTVIPVSPGILAYCIWAIGIFLSLCVLVVTATAVASVAFEDLSGNEVFQVKDALTFSRKHGLTAVVSLLILGLLVLLFLATFGAAGIIGRIPALGKLLVALMSLPLFFWALLGTFVFVVFVFGCMLVPAIVSCTGEDVLEILIQIFSTVFKQPLRLIWYEIVARIVVVVSTGILIFLSLLSFQGMYVIIGYCMGHTFSEILTIALYRIPYLLDSQVLAALIITFAEMPWFPYIADTAMSSTGVHVAGWILGISQLLVLAWIVSYCFSCFTCSQVLVYLAIRKQQNGDDLREKRVPASLITESQEKNDT